MRWRNILYIKVLSLFFFTFNGSAQNMSVSILGGSVVTQGSTISITAGNALTFQIINTAIGNCGTIRIQSVTLNNANFSISPSNLSENIKPNGCNGKHFLNFTITRNDSDCITDNTLVTINSSEGVFTFTLSVDRSPIISVLGGNPMADVNNGDTTTKAANGTYFGVVEEGFTQTRRFYISNTGSCALTITSITSSLGDFTITTPASLAYAIASGSSFYFDVTFLAPATAGANTSTISIASNDITANPFTFNISAEVFNFNIPGPGGITADFRLWLKTTRGVKVTGSNVYEWKDLGSNGKDASQPVSVNQPTYIDAAASNINFNPVIKFENNGSSIEQYMYNANNGFYSQDIFIVMIPDVPISSNTSRNTIFGGLSTGGTGDITGVGFGNYSSRLTNEILTYSQNFETTGNFNAQAEISTSKTYTNAGIINVRNNANPVTAQELLYNSNLLTTSSIDDISYANVGSIDPGPPSIVLGTKYWIGRNLDVQGSLNGRVAEIMTFAERVPDTDRPKIETYLAIKYGITLGSSTQAEKDYSNSFGTKIWDISLNAGYNYNIAGIGRDSISDLNQKQSKSLNETNEITIGLGLIFDTNSKNTNEFKKDGDFLVWGCDNGAFSGANVNTVTIAAGITTSLTRIDRKWKIVESKENIQGDVENIFVSIPSDAFSSFSKNSDEEYVLIVSDTENFQDTDIIDVIPLKSDGGANLQTWYDFDDTKFFTFGKAPKLAGNRSMNIGSEDYLVGEYNLNLNINSFTISAWVKSAPIANWRTILAKGNKLQLRLNSANKIEVMVDDDITPRFISNMILNDSKWHQITFVYNSGSIFLYVDGILDKSVQGVEPPSPNFNRFSVGAIYIDKNNIINPFLGEIDEIYVWDIGLTQNQVRYLMNQEIEKVTGDLVSGKVIPKNIINNEVITIPWSDLRAYYDFNSFYGSTVEGLTDARNFLRLKYLTKDKEIVDSQTAPLPYFSVADGAWDETSTWANNGSQNLPHSIGLDGTNIDWNIVETSHNISSGNRDIALLGLILTGGKITIANATDPLDETNGGQGLTVSHYLELDGVIDLVGESQLIQREGSTLDIDSGGYIERDQQGTANSFNYNYWSSSVGPISGNTGARGTGIESVNNAHTIGYVGATQGFLFDGYISGTPKTINFQTPYAAADAGPTSPITVSSYWLWKYNGIHDDYDSWVKINETTNLEAGEGYTMKGASGNVAITTQQNYVFKGKPNNGDITLAIAPGNDRLIGNPYPSSLDADEFILDNIKENINFNDGRNTKNVFNGALYFWHHFGQENSHILAEYVGGYATYTLMGGTEAYSTDELINNSTPLVGGGKVPERYIPPNQGFFVNATLDVAVDSTTTTVDGGNIVFKNSQRVFVREGYTGTNDGALFFKSNVKSKTKETKKIGDIRAKIRLKFNSPKGFQRQLLVGVDEFATNNFDIGYDALIADLGKEDLFWTFNGGKFVIQGVNNFNEDQELPLGLKLEVDGLAVIKIDALENIDESVKLYIKDKLTGETHQINSKHFEINLVAGEYLDRFSLVFQPRLKTLEEIELEEGIHIFMNNPIDELQIKRIIDTELININLYNYLGQNMRTWNSNIKGRNISLPINNLSTGVYFIQINTINGSINKKIIIE